MTMIRSVLVSIGNQRYHPTPNVRCAKSHTPSRYENW